MTGPCRALTITVWLTLSLLAADAHAQTSPFAPGGPLEPWRSDDPLRRPSIPAGGYPAPGSGGAAYARPTDSPFADKGVRPRDGAKASRTYVAVIGNPALAPWGKLGGRLEIAPLPAHAIFVELSKIDLSIDIQKGMSIDAQGVEYDIGYHLFPQGAGARGFYIGPRFIVAQGESTQAIGRVWGVGGDLGYQLVVAEHVVLNLGVGIARVHASADAKQSYVDQATQDLPDKTILGGISLGTSKDLWIPLATAGFGLAF